MKCYDMKDQLEISPSSTSQVIAKQLAKVQKNKRSKNINKNAKEQVTCITCTSQTKKRYFL